MGSVYTGTHKEREDHKQGHGEKGLGEWVASLTGARMRAKSHGEVVWDNSGMELNVIFFGLASVGIKYFF